MDKIATHMPSAKKNGGSIPLAGVTASGLLLAAHKLYKDLVEKESRRPASAAVKPVAARSYSARRRRTVGGMESPQSSCGLAPANPPAESPSAAAPVPFPAAAPVPFPAAAEPTLPLVEDDEQKPTGTVGGKRRPRKTKGGAAPIVAPQSGGKRRSGRKHKGGAAPLNEAFATGAHPSLPAMPSILNGAISSVTPTTLAASQTGGKPRKTNGGSMGAPLDVAFPEQKGGKRSKKQKGGDILAELKKMFGGAAPSLAAVAAPIPPPTQTAGAKKPRSSKKKTIGGNASRLADITSALSKMM
jgi:hypothetical protein